MADGRRVAFGWIREGQDELAGQDRSRVGVMSLPRELFLDSGGTLRSRPVRELDRARRETMASLVVHGRGSAGIALSARSGRAAEFSVTPAGHDVTAVGLRLAGPASPTCRSGSPPEASRSPRAAGRLTEEADPARRSGAVGQIRAYYDGGILEVFSPAAPAAAVICRRDGCYDRLDVDVSRPARSTARTGPLHRLVVRLTSRRGLAVRSGVGAAAAAEELGEGGEFGGERGAAREVMRTQVRGRRPA